MTGFVDLQRRFHEFSDSELEDIESLLAWSGSEFGPDIGWSELLQYARVILLAEAGSGKSDEMREQARHLTGEGRFAFFIPLESLGSSSKIDILEVLSVEEGQDKRFKQWKAGGRKPAWFFLDAVDELKLSRHCCPNKAIERPCKLLFLLMKIAFSTGHRLERHPASATILPRVRREWSCIQVDSCSPK